jgi:nucleoside-diphosphate kinase
MTQTLSIIKPDATRRNLIGAVLEKLEKAHLKVVAMKMLKMSKEMAGDFYAEHKERPFFKDLVNIMSSGAVVVMVLEGDDAIMKNRKIMGATNPLDAEVGTIRKEFAESIDANTVHGSDSVASAAREIKFFFKDHEIIGS